MLGALVTALGTLGLPQALPAEAAGWRPSAPAARYDAESIFRYIDGLGEVYRAYGMTACLAQRYAGPPGEGDIVVDVFETPSSAEAFGLFSHSREGETPTSGKAPPSATGPSCSGRGATSSPSPPSRTAPARVRR